MTVAPVQGIRTGPPGIPEVTLGWGVIEWCETWLTYPDGPLAGEPWRFTDEQARFVLWWYALRPTTSLVAPGEVWRFMYYYGMLRRMKGWGKDPLGCVLCCAEALGPVRFGGFDRNGEPIGVPVYSAWVQIAAVSRDQTKNTMTLFPGVLSEEAIDEYGVGLGKELIYAHGTRVRIEAVTTSPSTMEGNRPTFVLKNETHHWRANNEGHAMSDVISRNAAKMGDARVLAISNAHAPGQDSDAERDYEAWLQVEQGEAPPDFLYDSLEAPEVDDLKDDTQMIPALEAARGDAYWIDVERLLAEIRSPRTSDADARRFYLNHIVAEEDKPFPRAKLLACAERGHIVPKGALISLGFDGSMTRDSTALVGTEVATGYQWPVGIWFPVGDPDTEEIRINEQAVHETVLSAFEYWNVWRMYCDPPYWREWIAIWAGRFGSDRVVEWWTNRYKAMAFALQDIRTAIDGRDLTHSGHTGYVAAFDNAVKDPQHFTDEQNEPMWLVKKSRPESPLKIDAAVAATLSWRAAKDAIAKGALDAPVPEVFFA